MSGNIFGCYSLGEGPSGRWRPGKLLRTPQGPGRPTSEHHLAPSVHSAEDKTAGLGHNSLDSIQQTLIFHDNTIGCSLKREEAPVSLNVTDGQPLGWSHVPV